MDRDCGAVSQSTTRNGFHTRFQHSSTARLHTDAMRHPPLKTLPNDDGAPTTWHRAGESPRSRRRSDTPTTHHPSAGDCGDARLRPGVCGVRVVVAFTAPAGPSDGPVELGLVGGAAHAARHRRIHRADQDADVPDASSPSSRQPGGHRRRWHHERTRPRFAADKTAFFRILHGARLAAHRHG